MGTTKQQKYVDHRASGIGKKDSAIMAGYVEKNAHGTARDLEKMPTITQALVAERAKNARMLGISRQDVLRGLKKAIDDAVMMSDPANQIAGWREIAKVCGLYAPEVKRVVLDQRAKTYLTQLEKLNDAELLQIANGDITDVDYEQTEDTKVESD
jgi:hypothetical protein